MGAYEQVSPLSLALSGAGKRMLGRQTKVLAIEPIFAAISLEFFPFPLPLIKDYRDDS